MHDENVRRVQIAFLVILSVSIAQLVWWVIDQSNQARDVQARWQSLYEADVVAARALLDRGAREESILDLFPHLEIESRGEGAIGDERVRVAEAARRALVEERLAHTNQYFWEGGFFLAVLLASMSVVWRAVRRDAELRRWQDNFLAAVSHELKSPLASLQLAAETLDLRQLDAEHRGQLVERILADAERLGATVANVLDTHRLDQPTIELVRQNVVLRAAVDEALAEQEYRARSAGVVLDAEIPGDLEIEADPVGLRTVLRNLLDNALKAIQDGGRVDLRAEATESSVRLEVRDDGVGFPPEEAERLFDKFYRVGDELRRTRPGSGLGLHLTRRFVELEGGRVSATSDGPGRGATFVVTWPRPAERSP